MSARSPDSFRPTAAEAAALDSARVRFDSADVGQRTDLTQLSKIRAAAVALRDALAPIVMSPAGQFATCTRLAGWMQEAENLQRPMRMYAEELLVAHETAGLIARACAGRFKRGNKSDPRAVQWVCVAAEHWAAAGGRPSPRGRFAKALRQYHRRGLPPIGGAAQLSHALAVWREVCGIDGAKAYSTS